MTRFAWLAVIVALCVTSVDAQLRIRLRQRPAGGGEGGSSLESFTFTQTGWATFGVALKQGDATSDNLKLGTFDTQVDVKRTWGDGSIKHAIVTANIPTTGTYALAADANTTGSFSPTWPALTVTLSQSNAPGGGASPAGTYVATLGSYTAADPWLSGPHVNCARAQEGGDSYLDFLNVGTPHTNLHAVIDVCMYSDGDAVIDLTIENTIDNATNKEFIYAIACQVSGGADLCPDGTLWHLPFTRKTKRLEIGSPDLAQWSRTLTPFYRAAAFPQYLSDVDDTTIAGGDLINVDTAAGYTSMDGLGPFLLPMESHGGRPEIGLLTGWVVNWIAHQRWEQWKFVEKLPEYAGNYAVHVRKSDNTDILRVANGEDFFLQASASGSELPANGAVAWLVTPASVTSLTSNGTTGTVTMSGGVPGYVSVGSYVTLAGVDNAAWNATHFVLTVPNATTLTFAAPDSDTTLGGTITLRNLSPTGEVNHMPSMAYAQYLVSGRRYAMDEMIYWANFAELNTSGVTRAFGWGYDTGATTSLTNAGKGYINAQGTGSWPELRGSAWGLRDLAFTAAWLPDSHALKTYFTTLTQNNLNDHAAYMVAMATAPAGDAYGIYQNNNTALDAPYPIKRPEDGPGFYPSGLADNKTWLSGFEQPYLAAVFHYAIRNQGWTGYGNALANLEQFWSRLADTNQIPSGFTIADLSPYIIAVASRTYAPTDVTFYTTLQQVYDHTYLSADGGVDGPVGKGSEQNAPFIRSLLMIAAQDGYTGASAGVTYLERSGGVWDLNYRSLSEYTPWAFASVTVPN